MLRATEPYKLSYYYLLLFNYENDVQIRRLAKRTLYLYSFKSLFLYSTGVCTIVVYVRQQRGFSMLRRWSGVHSVCDKHTTASLRTVVNNSLSVDHADLLDSF